MTTPEIERELTAVLQRHAEVAMSRTDTQAELKELHDRVEGGPPRGGRGRLVGAAVAAAAAVVLGVALLADVTDWRADQAPAQDLAPGRTADEQVAHDFAEALLAGDAAQARSLLAEGTALPEGWGRLEQRNEAWSTTHDVKPCEAMSTTDYGTRIICPFDYHNLRSEQLGLGPFGNNNVNLVVGDEGVRSFQVGDNSANNGDEQLYHQIGTWVRQEHPGEWRFLDSPDVGPAEMPRWVRLWQQRTQEYADAMTAG